MKNQTSAETEPIFSKVERRERGFVEAILRNDYFLDPATRQVTLVVKRGLSNPSLPNDGRQDQEVSRKVLSPNEIPEEVRKKIMVLKDTTPEA